MFLFKKIVAPLLYPLSLGLEMLVLGSVLLWFSRRQRAGKILVTMGTLLLLLFSYRPIADMLLQPLERQYVPVTRARLNELLPPPAAGSIKWIVVLGGGYSTDPDVPMVSQLAEASLVRLVGAIQLYRELPEAKLILSGGPVFEAVPEAAAMARVARSLGVKQQDLILETASRDTEEQAQLIKDLVGKDRFLLVTSAAHLPRSVALFRKLGLGPIPCPVGHLVLEPRAVMPAAFFPWAGNLGKAEAAFHEYLGMAWARLRGRL